MKIEKIELNKIKVTVSATDLVSMNISVKSLTPDSPCLHNFLFEVMQKVQEETGFNPYSGQVMVEATPSEGGIILTVTRLGEEKPVPKRPKRVRVVSHRSPARVTYKFLSFEHLCGLFSVADSTEFEAGSLYEYADGFFMVMPKGSRVSFAEFAVRGIGAEALSESFLAEHGKLVASGAGLVSMADGVKKLEM